MCSDERIVQEFQDGDEKAFDRLYERYRLPLYSFFFRTLSNREDSLDLVQETLVAAYRALARWEPRAKFSTWLFTIATNQVRTHLRKTRRRLIEKPLEVREGHWGEGYEIQLMSKEEGPEERYGMEKIEEELSRGLRSLSTQQRTVFILRHQQEMKLKEIAEILELKEGTVKSHLFRAVRNLMEQFRSCEMVFGEPRLAGAIDE